MKKVIVLCVLYLLVFTTSAHARNWYDGYTVTKVYDQRPHRNQLDIDITPAHKGCTTMKFIVGNAQVTEEHLKSIQSTALAALLAGKKVGGLWDDEGDYSNGTNLCRATNLHISG